MRCLTKTLSGKKNKSSQKINFTMDTMILPSEGWSRPLFFVSSMLRQEEE
jgi:hypothetical protein